MLRKTLCRNRESRSARRVHISLISEIGRRIAEAMRLEQRLGLDAQRGHALSTSTPADLGPADCLLNSSRSGCKPPSLAFGRDRDSCSVIICVFNH